jgi:hypothetical protein
LRCCECLGQGDRTWPARRSRPVENEGRADRQAPRRPGPPQAARRRWAG